MACISEKIRELLNSEFFNGDKEARKKAYVELVNEMYNMQSNKVSLAPEAIYRVKAINPARFMETKFALNSRIEPVSNIGPKETFITRMDNLLNYIGTELTTATGSKTSSRSDDGVKYSTNHAKASDTPASLFWGALDLASKQRLKVLSNAVARYKYEKKLTPAQERLVSILMKKDYESLIKDGEEASGLTSSEPGTKIGSDKRADMNQALFTKDEVDEMFGGKNYKPLSDIDNTMDVFTNLDMRDGTPGYGFDKAHNDYLIETVKNIVSISDDINKAKITFSKAELDKIGGTFDTKNNEVNINVDTRTGEHAKNRFRMTHNEALAHEMSHAALEFAFESTDVNSVSLVSDLTQMYKKARKEFFKKDKLNSESILFESILKKGTLYSEIEKETIQDRLEYIFNNENGVKEFAAFALTNKDFADALETINLNGLYNEIEGNSIPEKILSWIKGFVESIMLKRTPVDERNMKIATSKLLYRMMEAEANAKDRAETLIKFKVPMQAYEYVENVLSSFDKVIKAGSDKIFEKYLGEADIKIIKREDYKTELEYDAAVIKAVEKYTENGREIIIGLNNAFDNGNPITQMYALIKTFTFLRRSFGDESNVMATKLKDEFQVLLERTEHKFVTKLYNGLFPIIQDFRGGDTHQNDITDAILVLKQRVDNQRESIFETTRQDATSWFKNINMSDPKNNKYNQSLTEVLLKPDIQAYTTNVAEAFKVLSEVDYKTKKMEEYENIIVKRGNKHMLKDAKDLGDYLRTGVGLKTNAENIAFDFGRKVYISEPSVYDLDQELVNAIDKYASLYALPREKYTIEVFQELYKEDKDGVEKFLQYTSGLQVSSKDELKDARHLHIKGYMRDSFDKDIDVQFVRMEEDAIKMMELKGYELEKVVERSPEEPVELKHKYGMFRSTYASTAKRASNVLGLQHKQSRGVKLSEKLMQEYRDTDGGILPGTKKRIDKIISKTVAKYDEDPGSFTMKPMYNKYGAIVDFVTTMSDYDKIKLMGKETRGTEIMSRTYSIFGTQQASDEHNAEVINMLHEYESENYKKSPHSFAFVGPKHNVEQWNLLSRATKEEALKLQKRRYNGKIPKCVALGFHVRKDVERYVFGYAEPSLVDFGFMKKIDDGVKTKIKSTEKFMSEITSIAKQNIIIKMPEVLIGNTLSNIRILYYMGVRPIYAFKRLTQAFKELGRYKNDSMELIRLKRDMSAGLSVSKDRIAFLEKSMEKNSAYPLIKDGLYQSIVEDYDTLGNQGRIEKFFENISNKLPTPVRAVADTMFLTKRTGLFKILLRQTQMSDFVFRYVQYWNAVDNNGRSHEEAIRPAIQNYINYEKNLAPSIQYMDKIMFDPFKRFYVNIQPVTHNLLRQSPGRVVRDMMLQKFVPALEAEDVFDNSMFSGRLPFENAGFGRALSSYTEALVPEGAKLAYNLVK